MTIVLATTNRKKAEEMKRMFAGHDFNFVTLNSFPGCPEVVEDGKTFRANAAKKARAVSKFTGLPAVADDSGLEVAALGGAPGIFSARYAGENANDSENVKKLLRDMRPVTDNKGREARFVCCIAFAVPDGKLKTFTGHIKGTIGKAPKGFNGFGYDPVFYPEGCDKTFAEMTDQEKDGLSHRGRAMKKLYRYLMNIP
ncbi:MAG: XTP/dITP diphosphatase [Nitrospirota bacterium]|nr:XTP/dITP diphosphatase [Nitrospirota bacterium]